MSILAFSRSFRTSVTQTAAAKLASFASITDRPFRLAAIGHSWVHQNDSAGSNFHRYDSRGIVRLAEVISNGRIVCPTWWDPSDPGEPDSSPPVSTRNFYGWNHGVNGILLADVIRRASVDRSGVNPRLARYIDFVINNNADAVLITSGESDAWDGSSYIQDKTAELCLAFINAGIPVFLNDIAPRNTFQANWGVGSTNRSRSFAHSAWRANFCATTPGMVLVPWGDSVRVGGAAGNADADAIEGAFHDGNHPGPLGAYNMGKVLRDTILAHAPNVVTWLPHVSTPYNITTAPFGNIHPNPDLDSVSGSAPVYGSFWSGDGARSFAYSRPTGTEGTGVVSRPARTGGGVWHQAVITPGTTEATFQIALNSTISSFYTTAVPGTWIKAWAHVEVEPHPGWRAFTVNLTARTGSTLLRSAVGLYPVVYDAYPGKSGTAPWTSEAWSGVIQTPAFQFPVGTDNSQINFQMIVNGAESIAPMTMRLGGMNLCPVAAPDGVI